MKKLLVLLGALALTFTLATAEGNPNKCDNATKCSAAKCDGSKKDLKKCNGDKKDTKKCNGAKGDSDKKKTPAKGKCGQGKCG